MKELICLFIGEAGIHIGQSILNLINYEHNLDLDGTLKPNHNHSVENDDLFINISDKKYTPRFLFIDTDPSSIDALKVGKYRSLLSNSNLVSGKEDSGNNSVRGYYTIGRELADITIDKIRKIVEGCKFLEGFLICHSITGGTGSGLTSLLIERISHEFDKKYKVNFCLFPSKYLRNNVVEPYNSIFSIHSMTEHIDVTNVLTNQSLYSYIENKHKLYNSSFDDLNSVISEVFSNFTTNLRFNSYDERIDISRFTTNIVPYPRIHYLVISHNKPNYNINSHPYIRFPNPSENVRNLFSYESNLTGCNLKSNSFMSCSLIYKGNSNYFEIMNAIRSQKESGNLKFVNWLPNSFNVFYFNNPYSHLHDLGYSTTMFSNSGAFMSICDEISKDFETLYRKRAFLHWFVGEGMDSGEFMECREDFAALGKDYEEVVKDSNCSEQDENNLSVEA